MIASTKNSPFSWWKEIRSRRRVGGVASHVIEFAAALQRMGNEVHVFTRMGQGQTHDAMTDGVHYYRCPFELNPNFIAEMNNMCRSFAYHFI
jgi:hypothetical protein